MERFLIDVAERSIRSEIIIGRGFPEPLLPDRPTRDRTVIMTQSAAGDVATRVSDHLRGAPIFFCPEGEEAKTLMAAGKAYEWLGEMGLSRHDTLIGVGGGAVTDATGFIGGTWQRGVETVLIPTTLLGAVDAAIGGKTALNLGGKNQVGVFHLPVRVVIDLDVVEELAPALLIEGRAEAIKAGLIGDAGLVRLFDELGPEAALDEVVPRAVAVKVAVVNGDYRDEGARAVLNFGHTVGHAVEVLTPLGHGSAVAVGMMAAGGLSALRYGFDLEWLRGLLVRNELPVAAPGLSASAVLELVHRDKKRLGTEIRMVLLRDVADPVIESVSEAELLMGLGTIGIGPGNLTDFHSVSS
ncbi:MAG TPA: 3-dehydroquinate synthase family protein [Acidimicrobiia bacterium]|jgi:3-dehydroquinate synthetase